MTLVPYTRVSRRPGAVEFTYFISNRGLDLHNECPSYDIKQSDDKVRTK